MLEKFMLVDGNGSNFLATTAGQIVLNKSLIMERSSYSRIVSITPIAVPPSSRVSFKVKGSNIHRLTTRFIILLSFRCFRAPNLCWTSIAWLVVSFFIFYASLIFLVMSGYSVHLRGNI